MQDYASEFSKIFQGWYPRTLTAGGAGPLPHPTPSLAFGWARGASAPVLGPKPWSLSTFQPWLHPYMAACRHHRTPVWQIQPHWRKQRVGWICGAGWICGSGFPALVIGQSWFDLDPQIHGTRKWFARHSVPAYIFTLFCNHTLKIITIYLFQTQWILLAYITFGITWQK